MRFLPHTCTGPTQSISLSTLAVPEVSGPERQRGSESGPGIGLVAGVVVAGLLLVVVVLIVVGILCAFKIRLRSKSVRLPTSADPGFGKYKFIMSPRENITFDAWK